MKITLQEIYDVEYTFDRDVAFVADRFPAGAALLEAGCGTGRVLAGLAKAAKGFALAGFDIDEAALAVAKRKLKGKAAVCRADAATFVRKERFDGVLFLFNGFMHMADGTHQEFLDRARAHLAPGGRIVVSVSNPDIHRMKELFPYYKFQKTIEYKKTLIDKFEYNRFDLEKQMIHRVFNYDYVDAGGVLHRVASRFSVRYFFRNELLMMFEKAGFEVETVLGDFDGRPWSKDAPQIVVCARMQ